MLDISLVLVLQILVFKSDDVCYFPPPAGCETGPDGDPKLVRLREVCLYQRDLLALRDQGLLHVSLL